MQKDPDQRPSATELLEHPFVQGTKSVLVMVDLLDQMAAIVRECGGREAAMERQADRLDEAARARCGVKTEFHFSSLNLIRSSDSPFCRLTRTMPLSILSFIIPK